MLPCHVRCSVGRRSSTSLFAQSTAERFNVPALHGWCGIKSDGSADLLTISIAAHLPDIFGIVELQVICTMKLCALSPALLGLVASVQAASVASSIQYSTVTGYFLQDETATDASTFDYVCEWTPEAVLHFGKFNDLDLTVPRIDCCQLWPSQPHLPRRPGA